jgi:hypothetical protein
VLKAGLVGTQQIWFFLLSWATNMEQLNRKECKENCWSTFFSGAVGAKVKRLLFTIALYQGSVVVPR